MTAISTATPRYAQATSTTAYPVNAGAHIYEGALVCVQVSDGMLVDGTAATGTIFAGIADQTVDGGAADGDVTARVRQKGVFTLAASSGAATNVGKPVYLVDNNTVAVAPQTGAILVGYCVKYNSATSLDVDITGYAGTPAGSGGSGSIIIRIVPGSVLGGTDSNVQFGALSNGDLIQYDSALQYWKNVAASSIVIGTATNINITDDTTTNADYLPVWVTTSSGSLPAKVTSTKLKFNPGTGVMTVTGGIGGGTF